MRGNVHTLNNGDKCMCSLQSTSLRTKLPLSTLCIIILPPSGTDGGGMGLLTELPIGGTMGRSCWKTDLGPWMQGFSHRHLIAGGTSAKDTRVSSHGHEVGLGSPEMFHIRDCNRFNNHLLNFCSFPNMVNSLNHMGNN